MATYDFKLSIFPSQKMSVMYNVTGSEGIRDVSLAERLFTDTFPELDTLLEDNDELHLIIYL